MSAASEPNQTALTTETKAEPAATAVAKAAAPERGNLEIDPCGRIMHADMAGIYNFATQLSRSELIPTHYRNKPMDVMVATLQSMNLKVPVLTYMQHSTIIHGKPAIESKLATAMLNQSGKIQGRIDYEYEKKGAAIVSCTAYCTDRETGKKYSATVDQAMVEGEGWSSKSGSKWKTMPEVMYGYRSALFLIRRYYPEILIGNEIAEEVEDISPAQRAMDPVQQMRERGASAAT